MNRTIRRATKILLIRHAEKPFHSPLAHGITLSGKPDKDSLTVRGWQRAGALVNFFSPLNDCFQDGSLAKPQFLYASKPVKHHGSRRSYETITPLSEKLAIKINSNFPKTAVEEMSLEALNCNGVVLICWAHEYIPKIANYILGNNTISPQEWSANRFDMVWIFDKASTSNRYKFKEVPQNLLGGDLNTPEI